MIDLIDNNYTFSLMIPLYYIIIYSIYFTKKYFEKKISRNTSIAIGIIIFSIILYLYINKYSEEYILSWIFKPIVPLIVVQYIPNLGEDILNISKEEKKKWIFMSLIGVMIMFIPGSNWYTSICRNIISQEYIISEILIYLCGILTIFLNKYYVNKILKIKRWSFKYLSGE